MMPAVVGLTWKIKALWKIFARSKGATLYVCKNMNITATVVMEDEAGQVILQ